jgi:hypothetical protein
MLQALVTLMSQVLSQVEQWLNSSALYHMIIMTTGMLKKRLYRQFPPLPGIQLGLQTHLAASTWFFVGSRLESTNNPLEPPAVGSEVTIGANDY